MFLRLILWPLGLERALHVTIASYSVTPVVVALNCSLMAWVRCEFRMLFISIFRPYHFEKLLLFVVGWNEIII